jgi:two-component system sensor histidine kinase QseC
MRRSIHHQLYWRLLIGILAISVGAGLLLYVYVRGEFLEQFDNFLALEGRSLAGLIKWNPQGQIELDFTDEVMPEFARRRHAEYYEVWSPGGTVLRRSPSLGSHDLLPDVTHKPEGENVRLPNGRPGRAITLKVIPRLEEGSQHPDSAPAALHLVVAQDRGELDDSLTTVFTALIITVILMSAVVPILVLVIVRRGLAPLHEVARRANEINAATLDLRFPIRGLPDEMLPICAKLNDLLDRLDAAFQRERRFTANAAHELRTPIAELRTLAEVALRSQPQATYTAACFQDALDIAIQMERLVAMLLALARGQVNQDQPIREICDLTKMVAEAWEPLRPAVEQRGLHADICMPDTAMVSSNSVMLLAILRNVLSNAVHHTPPGGEIICRMEKGEAGRWTLDVRNTNDSLTPADMPHLGEPFWRQAAARSDHAHSGLGLALIHTYAARLDVGVRTELSTPRYFCLALAIPEAAH